MSVTPLTPEEEAERIIADSEAVCWQVIDNTAPLCLRDDLRHRVAKALDLERAKVAAFVARTHCECCAEKDAKLAAAVEALREEFARGLERGAEVAEATIPRAHTYASENADIYRAQDDARDRIAAALRAEAKEVRRG